MKNEMSALFIARLEET